MWISRPLVNKIVFLKLKFYGTREYEKRNKSNKHNSIEIKKESELQARQLSCLFFLLY